MTDETTSDGPSNEDAWNQGDRPEAPPEPAEPKIMCYVSKVMVPLSQTVEVEYEKGKSFRVLPRYVHFDTEAI